ncbi:MAG: hypothetical protein IKN81_05370 [Oscillospiraceae bacterium]|nr:hypothetical protein [Oscillospiraceae bacterium]
MEITNTLNLEQANALFDTEAVFMCRTNVIPEYRVVELFGDDMAEWLDKCCRHDGYMKGGADYNLVGDTHQTIRVFYRAGFYKIAGKANYKLTLQSHRNCDAGKLIDAISEERSQELARQDAEYERKLAERRAKRAAAKAAKTQESSAASNQG